MIQLHCPRLRQLIVDTSPSLISYSQVPRFIFSGFLEATKSRTRARRDTIQFNDHQSDDGSGGPRLVSFRVRTHGGDYGSLRCLLDGYWDMLEEIVVDQLTAPSKSAELEQLLSYKCSSRLSTFSVNCGPQGHLWMEKLCLNSMPWPCTTGLRLTVGRAPDVLSASLVESFYNLVGQCSQLEELAIGYSIEQGSDMSDIERHDPSDPVHLYQFWDMTVRPSSWSTETPILMRARGCLQYLSGLSKLWIKNGPIRGRIHGRTLACTANYRDCRQASGSTATFQGTTTLAMAHSKSMGLDLETLLENIGRLLVLHHVGYR